jgi:uncharacterized MAPEG superfamily protein
LAAGDTPAERRGPFVIADLSSAGLVAVAPDDKPEARLRRAVAAAKKPLSGRARRALADTQEAAPAWLAHSLVDDIPVEMDLIQA